MLALTGIRSPNCFPDGPSGKEHACKCRTGKKGGLNPCWEDPLEEGMASTPVFLLGESRGKRSLAGHSP